MFDAKSLLDQFVGSAKTGQTGDIINKGKNFAQNNAAGLAGGALAGGLAGILLGSKKARKMGAKAATYGGMAVVGGLAYKAYKDYTSKAGTTNTAQPNQPQPAQGQIPSYQISPTPEKMATEADFQHKIDQNFARAILTAMLQAAKADGHIDTDEQQRIFDRIDELGLGVEEKAFVIDEMRAPLDLEKVVAAATDQETAIELYTASRMAIEPDLPAEKAYLQMLAARLAIPEDLKQHIDATIAEAMA
ncbi:tellurite resistance TerB family protein [Polycladidibacter stylochi]|uniref:tellurite resistance TerB family protein n=1 Tax=Polycladidibacter stylochi TaxID=1807766 RepID=UPI00082A0DEF|nr:tellurite resistance TerB family protein [Pseudovibrio stylochi]